MSHPNYRKPLGRPPGRKPHDMEVMLDVDMVKDVSEWRRPGLALIYEELRALDMSTSAAEMLAKAKAEWHRRNPSLVFANTDKEFK